MPIQDRATLSCHPLAVLTSVRLNCYNSASGVTRGIGQ